MESGIEPATLRSTGRNLNHTTNFPFLGFISSLTHFCTILSIPWIYFFTHTFLYNSFHSWDLFLHSHIFVQFFPIPGIYFFNPTFLYNSFHSWDLLLHSYIFVQFFPFLHSHIFVQFFPFLGFISSLTHFCTIPSIPGIYFFTHTFLYNSFHSWDLFLHSHIFVQFFPFRSY